MAQKKIVDKRAEKRAERKEKSERNMNRAVVLLIAGLVAEWYLLMADRYYARGTFEQLIAWDGYLAVMRWVGLGVFAVGAVLWLLTRKSRELLSKLGVTVAGIGAFFALTSVAMRHNYPTSVTVLCVVVPVLLILGIIYLFYQAEFSLQATALAMALGALVLLGRSSTNRVKACAVLALIGIAALLACAFVLKSRGGAFERGGKRIRVFPANADYRPILAVPALGFVLVALALAVPTTAFYAIWALAVVTFVLAVYYTIKLM